MSTERDADWERLMEDAEKRNLPGIDRIMAETILRFADGGLLSITENEREQCERIAIAPRDGDIEWLMQFESRLPDVDEP
jgi:hypothetical protein